ncbi:MAG: hypothetical protein FWF38_00845 [Spirochaetaceae bacterium]|nr:hypothetical protein [Spirochaetaceae bacterium]
MMNKTCGVHRQLRLSRALVCIFENYQQEDGSILIPEKLIPYAGFNVIKRGTTNSTQ